MFEVFAEQAKQEFAERIRVYRKHTGLSQEEFGAYFEMSRSTINSHELGKKAIGIDKMEVFARGFGLRHFQMADKGFPIPAVESLPAKFKSYIKRVLAQRSEQAAENDAKRKAGEKIYTTGLSKQLHTLVANDFFKRARNAKEIFLKIYPDANARPSDADQLKEISKITATLSQGRFAKLLEKLDPIPGSTAVRFLIKDPNNVKYLDNPSNATDLAAEE